MNALSIDATAGVEGAASEGMRRHPASVVRMIQRLKAHSFAAKSGMPEGMP